MAARVVLVRQTRPQRPLWAVLASLRVLVEGQVGVTQQHPLRPLQGLVAHRTPTRQAAVGQRVRTEAARLPVVWAELAQRGTQRQAAAVVEAAVRLRKLLRLAARVALAVAEAAAVVAVAWVRTPVLAVLAG